MLWSVQQPNCSNTQAGTFAVSVVSISTMYCSEECRMQLYEPEANRELPKQREFPFISPVAMMNDISASQSSCFRNYPDWTLVN